MNKNVHFHTRLMSLNLTYPRGSGGNPEGEQTCRSFEKETGRERHSSHCCPRGPGKETARHMVCPAAPSYVTPFPAESEWLGPRGRTGLRWEPGCLCHRGFQWPASPSFTGAAETVEGWPGWAGGQVRPTRSACGAGLPLPCPHVSQSRTHLPLAVRSGWGALGPA